MAQQGTYAGITMPQVSGAFEGEGALSRIASREFQERARIRAEEREVQRRMQMEAMKAVENAVQAGNIDMSAINTSVHGLVSKSLDNYAEKLVTITEDMQDDYSYQKQMELANLRMKFASDIGQLTGIGAKIKTISQGEYDPLLSAEPINGNFKFIQSIPSFLDDFDPDTMSVKGKKISSIYDEMVDVSKLKPVVNSFDSLTKYTKFVLDKPKTIIQTEGNIERTIEEYSYTEEKARAALFDGALSADEIMKEKQKILRAYNDDPEDNQYITIDDGKPYVSDNNLYEYVRDTFLEPNKKRLVKERQVTEKELTWAQQNALQKEIQDKNRKIKAIEEAITAQGAVIERGSSINIQGAKGEIREAKLGYNPFLGKVSINVDYSLADRFDNTYNYTESYDPDERGLQRLGNDMYDGKFDYLSAKEDSPIPKPKINFDQRRRSIEERLSSQAASITDRLKARDMTGDTRPGIVRAYDYITGTTGAAENDGLESFLLSYLGIDKGPIKKYKIKERPTLVLEKGRERFAAKALANIMAVGQQMKAAGENDKAIVKTLTDLTKGYDPYKNQPFEFEFDRVRRYIAGKQESERGTLMTSANELLLSGMNDDEVITELKDGPMKLQDKALLEAAKLFEADGVSFDEAKKIAEENFRQIAETQNMDVSDVMKQFLDQQ